MSDEQLSMTLADANAEHSWLDGAIEHLSGCLKQQQPQNTQTTAPKGFDKALESLSSDELSQSFATKGFWAWLAYFLADTKIRQHLSALSPNARLRIADEVSKVEVDASLVARVQHTLYSSTRGGIRLRLLTQSGIGNLPSRTHEPHEDPAPLPSESSVPTPRASQANPAKRPRVDCSSNLLQPTNSTLDTMLQQNESNTIPQSGTAQLNVDPSLFGDPSLPPLAIDPRRNYICPMASRLPFVFEHDLGSAIVRYGYKASVLLTFEDDPSQCKVVMDIQPSAVIWVAMNFYGVRIREQGQQRAVIHQGITSMEIIGTLRFQETELNSWDGFLGNLVSTGVRCCEKRQKEVEQGFMLSRCLTLEVPGAADCPGRLILNIDPNTANTVWMKLWHY